ncbi:MAG: leucine-rich repeat protein [Oscillospiraceae bacterium]|nr:leucine-rich repeat protein [Oscillospiraceae bacterium]
MKILNTAAALLLSFSLFGVPMPVSAETAQNRCGDRITWSFDGADTLTLSGSGRMWDFEVYSDPDNPELPAQTPPVSIPWTAYADRIRRVRVEGDIENIGIKAFRGLYAAEEIILPDSVREIGGFAFYECTGLQALTLPDGLTAIGENGISHTGIREITLPDAIRQLGREAFSGNQSLTAVRIPEVPLEIGDACFAFCPALTEIAVPDAALSVGQNLMLGDDAWETLHQDDPFVMLNSWFLYTVHPADGEAVIPEGVTAIDPQCFDPWRVPTLCAVTLPDSLTELPDGLFRNSIYLQSVHIGAGVRTLPPELFRNCRSLREVTLPDGLSVIGAGAFSGCSALRTVRIPESVVQIGQDAFADAPFLESEELLICGNGILLKYNGGRNVLTLPAGIRAVADGAFLHTAVVSLTLPDTVRRLEPGCFQSVMLTEIILNDGLTEIPKGAFRDVRHLSAVSVPESVTDISDLCRDPEQIFTVSGKSGSAAERFADNAGLPFSDTGSVPHGPDMTLHPESECWSFRNSSAVFGKERVLSDDDRALLEQAALTVSDNWSGACFGMCATVLLAKNGIFRPQQIAPGAQTLSELSPDPAVLSLINYYHEMQQTAAFTEHTSQEYLPQTIYRMIRTAERIPDGASPFMICFDSSANGRHAIIGYGTEHGRWAYMGREWTERILTYDPNRIDFGDANCLYYDPEDFAVCIPAYQFQWNAAVPEHTTYLTMCGDTDILNTLPYPFAERFGAALPAGDVSGDGILAGDDVTMLLDDLLCRTQLSAAAAKRADITGDGRITAADLAALKRAVMRAAA